MLLITPFYHRWGNGDIENPDNLLNISQLINGRTQIESRLATSRVIVFTSQGPQVIRLPKESQLLCDIHDSTFNHNLTLQHLLFSCLIAFSVFYLKCPFCHWNTTSLSRNYCCLHDFFVSVKSYILSIAISSPFLI